MNILLNNFLVYTLVHIYRLITNFNKIIDIPLLAMKKTFKSTLVRSRYSSYLWRWGKNTTFTAPPSGGAVKKFKN